MGRYFNQGKRCASIILLWVASGNLMAAMDFQVRVFAVGEGNVVPPNEPFPIRYEVTGDSSSDHYYYVDGSLKKTRSNSSAGSQAGEFSVTYPGGFSNGDRKTIAVCLDHQGDLVCDDVSVRAGSVLQLDQAVEVHTVGINNHVPAGQKFDIFYDVLKPTSSSHYYYVDGDLAATQSKGSNKDGEFSITYPWGLAVGETTHVEICVDTNTAQACGSKLITGGPAPAGGDVPDPFDSTVMGDHFVTYGSCDPVCGYYENIYYGDSSVSWLPTVGPDSEPNGLRMDVYYPTADGRVHSGSERNTLVIYAHSANHNKETMLGPKKGTLAAYLGIEGGGSGGVTVAALDFRHPAKDVDGNMYPVSKDDMSHAVQFFRYYADVFKINPDDIFITGSSLGAGAGIHAAVKEVANPDDPYLVRRVSSRIRGAFLATGQSSFSPQWFKRNFLEEEIWPYYLPDFHDDEERSIYGHAVANVDEHAPILELAYEQDFISHKVTASEKTSNEVDVTHLPNFGLALQNQYKLHGIGDRIMVRESYGGSFGGDSTRFIERNRLSGN
ncbi:alpha/beta hydrolase family protein [Alcanivorax sediminis]|uniref:Uncharacterized protein n=1 Tax=Alcanivorax sediminis TaxID=2663008 RepID=A0A6N7LPC9_9GAMM|nr:hypothetical protein [Alcanivorax sediminis]MQX52017.1 hypothetical protein [Alcanivorax sediminis]